MPGQTLGTTGIGSDCVLLARFGTNVYVLFEQNKNHLVLMGANGIFPGKAAWDPIRAGILEFPHVGCNHRPIGCSGLAGVLLSALMVMSEPRPLVSFRLPTVVEPLFLSFRIGR